MSDVTLDFKKEFLELKEEVDEMEQETSSDQYEDEDTKLFKKHSKKKKDKKKKKKKPFVDDKLELLLGDFEDEDSELTDDEIISMKKPKKGKKKDVFDEKKAKKERKKNIQVKFAPQLAALRKILKDADVAADDITEIFSAIKNSKSKYVGKTLTDLLQARNTANSTRASIVRDIANINKTMVELELKSSKDKKDKDKDSGAEEIGNRFFENLFSGGGGRKALKEAARGYYENQEDEYSGVPYESDEDLNDEIERRLDGVELGYRSKAGSKYIEHEADHVEDCVLYHTDGSWEMGAIDKHGSLVSDEDYPILDKKDFVDEQGNGLVFDLANHKATDKTGRTFKVVEIPD